MPRPEITERWRGTGDFDAPKLIELGRSGDSAGNGLLGGLSLFGGRS